MPKIPKIPNISKFITLILLFLSLTFNLVLLKDKLLSKTTKKGRQEKTVTKVIDGDTFDTKTDRVRLAGVDAPEYPQGCLSQEGKERLGELILGKTVRLEVLKKDNFGRSLAYVFIDNLFVDQVLVEEGLGQAQTQKTGYDYQLERVQFSAQKAQRGIWSQACQTKQEGCLIKGNVRRDKGTKIYHLPGCFNYPKIVINESEGDRWFCTEDQAQAAGFTKSQDCPKE